MANNPIDDRPRRKGPPRGGSRRQGSSRRNGGQMRSGGGRQHQSRGGRLNREELEWARDLWQYGEPPDEIANQLGIEVARVEELIAGWAK